MPQLSIIVPVYKVEDYLERCINSILNQSFQDFELILIDDGSPDKCPELCDTYAKLDNRIIVIHKENGGVSSARNIGLQQAKGKYVTFIDADDWIDSEYLEIMYKLAEDNSVEMVCCTLLRDDGEKSFSYTEIPSEDIKEISLSDNNFKFSEWYSIHGPVCKLVKKSLIDNNNLKFDEQLSIGEDLLFYVEMMKKVETCICISKPLYHYFQRPDSAMHDMGANQLYSEVKAWYMAVQALSVKWDSYQNALQKLLWNTYKFVIYACENRKKLEYEQIQFIQKIFRLTKKYRHLLAKGIKFEILYFLLEYNFKCFCWIARKKNEKK